MSGRRTGCRHARVVELARGMVWCAKCGAYRCSKTEIRAGAVKRGWTAWRKPALTAVA